MIHCSECNSQNVINDEKNYILVCEDCGNVLEESHAGMLLEETCNLEKGTTFVPNTASVDLNKFKQRIYFQSIKRVFDFFKFPQETTREIMRFYINNRPKFNQRKSIETAIVLASLVGSNTRSGWLAADYANAYYEQVDVDILCSIQLAIAPLYLSFKQPIIQSQAEFVIEKIYTIIIEQLEKKYGELYIQVNKQDLKLITKDLLCILKEYGLTEGSRIRPFVCVATLISSQHLQRKNLYKKRIITFKRYWDTKPIAESLGMSENIIGKRYSDILGFLDAYLDKITWLRTDFRNSVFHLDRIINNFKKRENRLVLPGYRLPYVIKAEEKREQVSEAIGEAKKKFDSNTSLSPDSNLEFHTWNLLKNGLPFEIIKGWHESIIVSKSQAMLYKNMIGGTSNSVDLDATQISELDMSEREAELYLK